MRPWLGQIAAGRLRLVEVFSSGLKIDSRQPTDNFEPDKVVTGGRGAGLSRPTTSKRRERAVVQNVQVLRDASCDRRVLPSANACPTVPKHPQLNQPPRAVQDVEGQADPISSLLALQWIPTSSVPSLSPQRRSSYHPGS